MSFINCIIVSPDDQAILLSGFNVWNGIWDCYSMGFGSCHPNISRLIQGTKCHLVQLLFLFMSFENIQQQNSLSHSIFPTYSWKQSCTGDPSVRAAEDTVEQSWLVCHIKGRRKDRLQLSLLLFGLEGFFLGGCCFKYF